MSDQAHSRTDASREFSVLEATAEWYSIMHADDVSEDDKRNWHAWLQADQQHRQAWQRVTEISKKFERLPDAVNPLAANSALLSVVNKPRRRSLKLLSLIGAVSVIGLLTARTATVREWLAQYHTGVGEQRQIQLADGTIIWLNTNTALDVDYDHQTRTVRLLSGEIFIQTAADNQMPARPFLVDTSQGQLRPLGTRFSVRADAQRTHLAVFEGAVEVSLAQSDAATRKIVEAGLQTNFSTSGFAAIEAAALMHQAWIRGVLIADNMRLGDFIKELRRYHHGFLACDPAVDDLRIVGAFPVKDTGAILSALAETLPIRIHEHTSWWISIDKKDS